MSSMTGHKMNHFVKKIKFVQYKATLAIAVVIQGISRDKIYQELGLEKLKSRRWYKRLFCMFRIMNEKTPNDLINLIREYEPTIRTRNNGIPYKYRTNSFNSIKYFCQTLRVR